VNKQHLVSIAIAAHRSEFFRATLKSVVAQDYPALEIVVCDDSQGHEIKAIFDELRSKSPTPMRYVRAAGALGFAKNLLLCLENCRGDFVKFLCDDDTLLPGCISKQAQVLASHAGVSMVINQRLLFDAEENLLPSRPVNCIISPGSAVLHGGDLLEIMQGSATNLFGGISHALFRLEQLKACLPALVDDGRGFVARLDSALYVCLLHRGYLACLEDVLSLERIHPAQLSNRTAMKIAFKHETQWLLKMLAERNSEPAPASGWVRYLGLDDYHEGTDKVWSEFELGRLFTAQVADFSQQVGTYSNSFAELYAEWLQCRSLSAGQLKALPGRIEQWLSRPKIVPVVQVVDNDVLALRATLESVGAQSYGAHQVWLLAAPDFEVPEVAGLRLQKIQLNHNYFEQLNRQLADEQGADWIFLLNAGDRLHPDALVILAERIVARPGRQCLYTDEGALENLEPKAPIFKPSFNLDLMRSFPYVGRLLAFHCPSLRKLGGFSAQFESLAPHDLLWRMVEATGPQTVEHVPEVLVQCLRGYGEFLANPAAQRNARNVVEAHLKRLGVNAHVSGSEGSLISRITYLHDSSPMVSVMVDAGLDLPALVRCVESILSHTAYGNYEVLVLGSTSDPSDIQAWLAAMAGLGGARLRILSLSATNPAARINEASVQARGDYLLLLSNCCALFQPQWLDELMHQAQRPEVGVVGPLLCKPNGTVYGAGLILGLRGPANTPFLDTGMDAPGYMNRMHLVQNMSAVPLDCLLIRKAVFSAVAGLDCKHLEASLLDADLCLRVAEQGYLVTWTPFSQVACISQEEAGAGAGRKVSEQDRNAFYERWLPQAADDPAYNRNFSLKLNGFDLDPGNRTGWNPFVSRTLPSVLGLPINVGAVGHYRVAQPFNELEAAGWIEGRLNYGMPHVIALERLQPDTVIFQCRYSDDSVEEFATAKRFSNARRIYELDDYIIDVPKKNAHARNLPTNMRERVSRGIAMCDRVVVSTAPLAEALSSMHRDIRVVPNMLAASLWAGLSSQRQTSARPRVGWAGGTSHRGDLELLADVVKALAGEVDWVFFGMCPEALRPYVKEFHTTVALGSYPQKLASLNLDLALAPLEINLFNDCKSNLRLLEYGACGFPVICTDTKAYRGYLPCTRVRRNTTKEWLDAIRMHLADPGASYRQGDALREVVLRDYVLTEKNLQLWANAWLAD